MVSFFSCAVEQTERSTKRRLNAWSHIYTFTSTSATESKQNMPSILHICEQQQMRARTQHQTLIQFYAERRDMLMGSIVVVVAAVVFFVRRSAISKFHPEIKRWASMSWIAGLGFVLHTSHTKKSLDSLDTKNHFIPFALFTTVCLEQILFL